jgi:hypothetical protein
LVKEKKSDFNKILFLYFKVIASSGDEKKSTIHYGDESSGSSNDYTERRSLAITIPDYTFFEISNEKFYVSYDQVLSFLNFCFLGV